MREGEDMAGYFVVISVIIMISAVKSYGYIDLGTGSYILQILLAGILGGLYAFKGWIRKAITSVMAFFSKQKAQS